MIHIGHNLQTSLALHNKQQQLGKLGLIFVLIVVTVSQYHTVNNEVSANSISSYFKKPVEWDPEEKDVSEELNKRKDTVHHPVSQPLCIIIFLL